MTQRYTPDARDRQILTFQLDALSRLVQRVDYTPSLNAARAMLRVLEAAARRLVMTLALMAPALKPQKPRPKGLMENAAPHSPVRASLRGCSG